MRLPFDDSFAAIFPSRYYCRVLIKPYVHTVRLPVVVLLPSGIPCALDLVNVLGISMFRRGVECFMRCGHARASIQGDTEKAERLEGAAGFSNSVLAKREPPVLPDRVRDARRASMSRPRRRRRRRRFVTTEDYGGTQKRYMFDAVKSRSLTRSTFVPRE
jgi:hypothetical protein